MVIVPALGSSSPAIMRKAVDLPQPEGPSSTRNSSSDTSRVRSSTAATSSKRFDTCSSATRPICGPSSSGPTPALSGSGGGSVLLRGAPERGEERSCATDADDGGDDQRLLRIEGELEVERVVQGPLPGPERPEGDAEHGHGGDVLVALLGAAEEEPVLEVIGEPGDDHQRAHAAVVDRGQEAEHEQ